MEASEFIVIWKYIVNAAHKAAFEKHYGSGGPWQDLFARSPGYMGSVLYRENGNAYLLIDHWRSKESYEHFLEKNRVAYEKMNDRYRHLYDEEERVGVYKSI